MKIFQGFVAGVSSMALIAILTAPALAEMTVIPDEEMDEVTAAGQPKISTASSYDGAAESYNSQHNLIAPTINGQQNLTALALNNIFGENQIVNAMNIQSGDSNEGSQFNDMLQSWGSARANKAVTVEGQPGGNGGNGAGAYSNGLISKASGGDGGNGGDAAPGKIALLWEFADEISDASSALGPAYSWNDVYTNVAVKFEENSQTNLTALIVNNIFGFNQVANGLNISSAGISRGGGTINPAASVSSDQVNVIQQYRGAPYKWWDAPTFSNVPVPGKK